MMSVRKVMVVDEDEARRATIERAIADRGLEVDAMDSLRAVVEAFRTPEPAVILIGKISNGAPDTVLAELHRNPLAPPIVVVGPVPETHLADAGFMEYVADAEGEGLLDAVDRALRFRQLQLLCHEQESQLADAGQRLDSSERQMRRDAESVRELASAELRYREAFQAASDAIFMVDRDGRIIDANLSATRLTGRGLEDLLGESFSGFEAEGSGVRFADLLARALASSDGVTEDQTLAMAGGKTGIVSVSATPVDFGGAIAVNLICRDVTEARRRVAQTVEYTRELEAASRAKDAQITESQAQLIQAERLATLGSMLAGLAHEIRTPLGAISGNNDVLEVAAGRLSDHFKTLATGNPDLADQCGSLCEILEDTLRTNRMASERLLAIVRGARNFARADTGTEKVDLHEGIESSLILLAHEMKGRIRVVREYADLPPVECHPSQLNQVFLNLLINAVHAIEDRGTIRIRTESGEDTVSVTISDDGVGMDAEVRRKVFEPGFTTKSSGVGSGLGLSISNSIVQNHGGRIDVESEPGRGTSFTITMPRKAGSE